MEKNIQVSLFNLIKDFFYSSMSLIIMNIVLQFIVYPFFSNQLGENEFGIIITLISIVIMCAVTFGSSLNYSRVVQHSDKKDSNGDYNILLLFFCFLAFFISIIIIKKYYIFNLKNVFLYFLLISLTIIRYYADVEYRINLNYKGYFLYYLSISIGYCIGLLTYKVLRSWFVVIIIGEYLSLLFVKINGQIFSKPYLRKSKNFNDNKKYTLTLVIANFIETVLGNVDKIIILTFIGSKEVTIFYVATLLGKTASLITSPLNTVIISHIVKLKDKMSKKMFIKILLVLFFAVIVLTFVTTIASYILLKFLYSNVYEEAKKFFILGNLGQLLNFLATTIMVIILKFVDKKYQVYVNVIHLLFFVVIVIPLAIYYGIVGIIYGLLIVNFIKYVLASFIGLIKIK